MLQLKVVPSYGVGIEKNFLLPYPNTSLVVGGEGLFNGQSQLKADITHRHESGATIRFQMAPQVGVGVERSWHLGDSLDLTLGGDAMWTGKSNVRFTLSKKINIDTGLFEEWPM